MPQLFRETVDHISALIKQRVYISATTSKPQWLACDAPE